MRCLLLPSVSLDVPAYPAQRCRGKRGLLWLGGLLWGSLSAESRLWIGRGESYSGGRCRPTDSESISPRSLLPNSVAVEAAGLTWDGQNKRGNRSNGNQPKGTDGLMSCKSCISTVFSRIAQAVRWHWVSGELAAHALLPRALAAFRLLRFFFAALRVSALRRLTSVAEYMVPRHLGAPQ
jgi:hypothetical protein